MIEGVFEALFELIIEVIFETITIIGSEIFSHFSNLSKETSFSNFFSFTNEIITLDILNQNKENF